MARVYCAVTGPVGLNAKVPMPSDFDPADNSFQAIGGGASGGKNGTSDGGGGGGGAWARKNNLSFLAGQLVDFRIGAGGLAVSANGPGNNGGQSWIGATSFAASPVGADGGRAGAKGNHGGAGGDAALSRGDDKFSGGAGGDGGGGGGAAGPNGDGGAGGLVGGDGASGGDGDAGSGGAGGTGPGTVAGANGSNITVDRIWDGSAWIEGPFDLGAGGGGRGAAGGGGPSGHGGGHGGLYGGGAGGRDNSGAMGAGAQGVIFFDYEPLAGGPFYSDF